MSTESTTTETTATEKPWLHAEGDTWWLVSGDYGNGGTFTRCIARVVPEFITGDYAHEHPATFEVLVWGDIRTVGADRIRAAMPLRLVPAESTEESV